MINEQIKVLYEEQGLGVKEIAEAYPEYGEEAIKIALAGCSGKYRKDISGDKELFSDVDEKTAAVVMSGLLLHENENIQFRAAKFVINERKGRHDKNNLKNLNINVNIISARMKKAKEAKKKALEKVIDV